MISSFLGATTVRELLEKQGKSVIILQEYWIDKDGDTHIGDKDPAMLEFSFSKNLLDNMTDAELRTAMNLALVKFTKEQQKVFKNMVTAQLDVLRETNQEIAGMRKKMEEEASALGKIIGRSQHDIMRLPDQNLKNIISMHANSIEKLEAYRKFTHFSQLRKEFAEDKPTIRKPTITVDQKEDASQELDE
jgi:hypothetical protein